MDRGTAHKVEDDQVAKHGPASARTKAALSRGCVD